MQSSADFQRQSQRGFDFEPLIGDPTTVSATSILGNIRLIIKVLLIVLFSA